jgi:hypothetical protein
VEDVAYVVSQFFIDVALEIEIWCVEVVLEKRNARGGKGCCQVAGLGVESESIGRSI